MHSFIANPTARLVPPRSAFAPSAAGLRRSVATPLQMLERHLRVTGMSASRLGRLVANDPALVFQMRNGREPSNKVIDQIDAYFREATHA